MSTHSSILAWRIPWTEEPGGLQSIGLQRVKHDCSKLACKHVSHIQIKEIVQQNEYKRMISKKAKNKDPCNLFRQNGRMSCKLEVV